MGILQRMSTEMDSPIGDRDNITESCQDSEFSMTGCLYLRNRIVSFRHWSKLFVGVVARVVGEPFIEVGDGLIRRICGRNCVDRG